MMSSMLASLVGPRERETYTEEEARNLEIIRQLRAARFEDRRGFSLPGVRPHRSGLSLLSERAKADGKVAYDRDSIADRQDEILDMIAKDDRVWAVWMVRGTHTGELCGFAPTGQPIEFLELGVWRLEDGKVAEAWFFGDEFALIEQLRSAEGHLPS